MQSLQQDLLSSPAAPSTTASPPLSLSSSSQQRNRHSLSSVIGCKKSCPNLPPIGKEGQRNGASSSDAPQSGGSYCNKMSLPSAPMSPSEEEIPHRFGRRFARQTSWNEGEIRPSSYYDGLRSPDSDRRDERMASLEALRRRREIPVTLRSRSSSLGREPVSILNSSIDPSKSSKNEASSYIGASRNISDILSHSSSSMRDSSAERSRRGMTNTSHLDSSEGDSGERSRRGTSSMSESVEGSDRSRRGTSSLNESRSNSPDKPILERLLQMKERHMLATRGARERSSLKGESGFEANCLGQDVSPCPPSRPISQNLPKTDSWNGSMSSQVTEAKAEEMEVSGGDVEAAKEKVNGEAVMSKKKGRHRISRFLRPDFFDTPREESAFAKKKDMEVANAAAVEKERKHKESSKSSFLHSLERQLDRLRGGEKMKKLAPVDGEGVNAVRGGMDGALPPECLTSAKLAAEVRKAKSVGPDDVANQDGLKRGSSRVDRAINSLLQREKGREVSESGLLKRAVGIEERARPSKSQSSGELAHYGVCSSLGKLLASSERSSSGAGGAELTNAEKDSALSGGKLSSKVNSVLGMFRRNEIEQTTPKIQNKRVRRTQSLAYDTTIPDDILHAVADCAASKSDRVACSAGHSAEQLSIQPEISPKKTSTNKAEKVKKSSKAAKEKSNAAKSKLLLQQKDKEVPKIDKSNEEACNECSNEKSPSLKKEIKKEVVESPPEIKNYDITVTLPKPARKENGRSTSKLSLKAPTSVVPETHSLLNSSVGSSNGNGDVSKSDWSKSMGGCSRLLSESKMVVVGLKEREEEASPINGIKQLDRTATQDSLDSSSWSACSDGGDLIGGGGERGVNDQGVARGDGGLVGPDPQRLQSPPPVMDGGERLGCDDESEESVGDRIRRKSFYCRFNDMPLRRRSSHHQRPTRHSSSLIYSASDLWDSEGVKAKSTSSQSRDGFSPPPPASNKPSAIVYRRSSTSPYHEQLPNPSFDAPHFRDSPATRGLRPTSSTSSLAQSNSGREVNEDMRVKMGCGMQEDGRRLHQMSPSSGAYQNGVLPTMHLSDIPPETERKSHHRLRKFRVPSLADGVTAPSPTHRKHNESSLTSLDGVASLPGGEGLSYAGLSSLLPEKKNPQVSHTSHLPPMGVAMSSKMKAINKS